MNWAGSASLAVEPTCVLPRFLNSCLFRTSSQVILNALALFWVTGASRQTNATLMTTSCVECDRQTTSDGLNVKNNSAKHLSKGLESMRSWEGNNRNSIRHDEDLELGNRRHSVLKSMNIFRMGSVPREAQEFQVRPL